MCLLHLQDDSSNNPLNVQCDIIADIKKNYSSIWEGDKESTKEIIEKQIFSHVSIFVPGMYKFQSSCVVNLY